MKGRLMPLYRLTPPGELVRADSACREGVHTALRGTVLVMGQPREVVLRRVPSSVAVEVVDESQDVASVRGLGAVPEPPETNPWEAEVTGGVVDLATGRGPALDHWRGGDPGGG